jgi:hypothetical protein
MKRLLAIALIVLAVALLALGREWIERYAGVEPDGGDGTLEIAIVIVPLVAGALLLGGRRVFAAVRRRARA